MGDNRAFDLWVDLRPLSIVLGFTFFTLADQVNVIHAACQRALNCFEIFFCNRERTNRAKSFKVGID
jgi:hypothetical protein